MSVFYSTQYNSAYVAEPKSKLEPKEFNGKVRRIYAEITLSAEITTADQVKLAKIPAGAVPFQCKLVAPGGSAGTLDLGWAANGSEVADPNGLIAGMSGAAAIGASMAFSDAGFNKRFASEVDVELSASVNTAGFTGDLIQFELLYIVE